MTCLRVRPTVSVTVSAAEKQLALAQIKEHRVAVLDLIEMYLKGESMNEVIHHTWVNSSSCTCVCCVDVFEGVCKLYSEQRAIRVKKIVDKKRT